MQNIWFVIVSAMLVAYMVLEGYDLGAGILHLVIAKGRDERSQILGSIGPVWNLKKTWLIAAGGTLCFAFPSADASQHSGFYLALLTILSLTVLRGLSIELRDRMETPVWDVVLSGSSVLLMVVLGAALGNLVSKAGILNWFTILMGIASLVVLTVHGCLWVALTAEGKLQARARSFAAKGWWALLAIASVMAIASAVMQPQLINSLQNYPWIACFSVVALAGLIGIILCQKLRFDAGAFACSAAFMAGILCCAAAAARPVVLPSVASLPVSGYALSMSK